MNVSFIKKESVSKDIYSFYFSKPTGFNYQPGQYIQMHLPHDKVDNRGDMRWFTLSSSPTEEYISITTRFTQTKSSSFKNTLFNLTTDSAVTINEPMGDFVLPKNSNIELLFISGGLGITPVRSIIKYLSDNNEDRKISIIYSVKTLDSAVFKKLIEAYGAKLNIVLSEVNLNWSGRHGIIDFNTIQELNPNINDKLIYISGPEPFVELVQSQLLSKGVEYTNLVLDFYLGYDY